MVSLSAGKAYIHHFSCILAHLSPQTLKSTRRDNRLTSLQGLSGLPNLRELRLDINHLTSLHELTSLPSLVELSANTNHISALPEGFAAALMAPSDPPTANSTNPVLGGGSVESTVASVSYTHLTLPTKA